MKTLSRLALLMSLAIGTAGCATSETSAGAPETPEDVAVRYLEAINDGDVEYICWLIDVDGSFSGDFNRCIREAHLFLSRWDPEESFEITGTDARGDEMHVDFTLHPSGQRATIDVTMVDGRWRVTDQDFYW